jgi:transposase-like protein
MPPRMAPGLRAAILEDLRGGKTRNRIARDRGVSPSSVSKIAGEEGISFDRAQTKSATEAATADARAVRAVTSRRFLDEANRLLDQMHQPHVAYNFGGKDNTYEEHEFPEPPVDAKRTLITAAAIAYDKHLAQERHDADDGQGLSAVDAWLRGMLGGTK